MFDLLIVIGVAPTKPNYKGVKPDKRNETKLRNLVLLLVSSLFVMVACDTVTKPEGEGGAGGGAY